MIKYRPHMELLADAMQEVRSFQDEDSLKRWLSEDSAKVWGVPMFDPEDVVFSADFYPDHRVGWIDTRYVCVKRYGSEVFPIPQCIGMCATRIKEEQP